MRTQGSQEKHLGRKDVRPVLIDTILAMAMQIYRITEYTATYLADKLGACYVRRNQIRHEKKSQVERNGLGHADLVELF